MRGRGDWGPGALKGVWLRHRDYDCIHYYLIDNKLNILSSIYHSKTFSLLKDGKRHIDLSPQWHLSQGGLRFAHRSLSVKGDVGQHGRGRGGRKCGYPDQAAQIMISTILRM